MSKADIKKPSKTPLLLLILLLAAGLSACDEQNMADAWLGKWIGPEGTYLVLNKIDDEYDVIIQSLDKIETFKGKADGMGVKFIRNNQEEKIYHGDGPATGMKWLAEKKDCLVVRAGEGYCRS